MFVTYLARRGTTPEALMRAHEDHFKQTARALQQRDPFDFEILDLRAMLAISGAAPISDSVATYCSEKSGRKAVGLWAFVTSFLAEKIMSAKRGQMPPMKMFTIWGARNRATPKARECCF